MAVEAYFNAKTVWVSEIDKYACKVIDARINKPNIGNLKIVNWAEVEPIDILTAGYPCQPFSQAGLRKGAQDERHLWPYIKEAISILRPKYVILENVRGHFGLGFREVLSDLASIGYDARWTLVRASEVGAPHRRERLFILAYPNSTRWTRAKPSDLQAQQPWDSSSNFDEYTHTDSDTRTQSRRASREVRAESVGLRGRAHERQAGGKFRFSVEMDKETIPSPLDEGKLNVKFVEYMMGLPVGWVTDVDLPRSQKLKILGNGVVPQQAYKALELLCNINSYPQGVKTCGQHAQASLKLSTI